MAEESAVWTMPLHGPVTEGQCVRLGWPEEREFDAITALRNRASVRRQFFDPRLLDPQRNREWLRSGMQRPVEALFSIRLKPDDVFVGTIGWSHGNAAQGSLELGRVMVDTLAVRPCRHRLPVGYPGVAVDAGIAVRDFAFTVLGVRLIRMVLLEANRLSLRAAVAGGARVARTRLETRPDGSTRRLVDLEFDREDWERWRLRQPRAFGAGRSAGSQAQATQRSRSSIPVFRTRVEKVARERVQRTLESGWLGYGPECRALEQTFVARAHGGWALATSSCTSALYLAARLVRKLAGDGAAEVIVPAVSFVASAMAFAQAGLRTVLADVDPETLLLDPAAVERSLTPRTRAIVVVHLYGQRHPKLAALRALADARKLMLVEDCAHRLDLLDREAPLGDVLCYSFNAVKELPAGEGGLLWARHAEHESWVRAVSHLGLTVDTMQRASTLRHADYASVAESGLKLRSNDVAAALVNAGLDALAATRAERREQAKAYDRALRPLAQVRPIPRADDDSFLMYVVKVPAALRDAVRAAMAEAGVATSVHYPSLARHPLLGDGRALAGCAEADSSIMTLPTFLGLERAQQQRVVDALAQALACATPRPLRTAVG